MARNNRYQYQPLITPRGWTDEEKRFVQRLSDILDDLYLKVGKLDEAKKSRFVLTICSSSTICGQAICGGV